MNYHNITYPDMNNGDGLRVVLWLSGCSHHCYKCQNPQTWDPNSGILFDDTAKEELFRELNKDYISGLTLTGGDPLNEFNVRKLFGLLKELKNKYPNKSIWIYTGYTYEDIIDKHNDWFNGTQSDDYRYYIVTEYCDVLIDGQYIEEKKDVTLKWVGSSNQRVIDVQKSLKKGEIVLYEN